VAERFGDERMLRFLRGVAITRHFYAGQWHEALQQAEEFIAECQAGAPHYLESDARWTRALIRLARADGDGAAADALRAEGLGREREDPQMLLPGLSARLRVEFELGHPDHAAALAAELLGCPAAVTEIPPAVELAWTAKPLQTEDAVRDWIKAIVVRSTWNEAALAILDGELERAAELFVQIGSLPDEARARLRAGDPENVGKALVFYGFVGASRYIRQGEALLAASA
jgi:hypothetical protein